MIQPLRTAHRRIFSGLAVVLPAVIALGLSARRPMAAAVVMEPRTPASFYLLRKSEKLWRKHAILSEFFGESGKPSAIYVSLHPDHPLDEPDVLVYWSNDFVENDRLPQQAQLLGAFRVDKALPLPVNAEHQGRLFLYSLAHEQVVDVAKVERLP